jgi:hypothetical protein
MDLMGDDELDGDELDTFELSGGEYGVGDDVLGDDVLGAALVGAARRRRKALARRGAAAVAKPKWRRQLAPGVPEPGYGVFPIPLTPVSANGVFTGGVANIEFRAVAQIPFRGERLVSGIARNGPTALGALAFMNNGVHIGIRPQVGVLGPVNLETFARDSFGVRMVMQAATQGAEIRVFAFVNPPLTGTDTLALSLEILGRVAT